VRLLTINAPSRRVLVPAQPAPDTYECGQRAAARRAARQKSPIGGGTVKTDAGAAITAGDSRQKANGLIVARD
jgi:hypothetical protein